MNIHLRKFKPKPIFVLSVTRTYCVVLLFSCGVCQRLRFLHGLFSGEMKTESILARMHQKLVCGIFQCACTCFYFQLIVWVAYGQKGKFHFYS